MSSASCRLALPENTSIELYGTSGPLSTTASAHSIATYIQGNGWGARIRTWECWNQNPVPYRLATPQQNTRIAAPLLAPAQPPPCRRPVGTGCEHRRARAAQAGGPEGAQPRQGFRHFRITAPHHGLADVISRPGKKGGYCEGRGVACQFRRLEHGSGRDVAGRHRHHIPGLRQIDRRKPLAHPLRPGRATAHEHRHVGAEGEPELGELIFGQTRTP